MRKTWRMMASGSSPWVWRTRSERRTYATWRHHTQCVNATLSGQSCWLSNLVSVVCDVVLSILLSWICLAEWPATRERNVLAVAVVWDTGHSGRQHCWRHLPVIKYATWSIYWSQVLDIGVETTCFKERGVNILTCTIDVRSISHPLACELIMISRLWKISISAQMPQLLHSAKYTFGACQYTRTVFSLKLQ